MKIDLLSEKQSQILDFIVSNDDMLICDGAVRSGKTIIMASAFIIWAMEYYDRTNFGICGKTVQSAERNVLKPLRENESLPYSMDYKVSTRVLTVRCGDKINWFYLFGGKDESSYMLIQGITLAGVLFDEVALMPKSFVEQALARAISFEHPKYWFNCNPESPNHYFYKEWIANPRPGVTHLHFLLKDNPILTERMIERTKSMYSGVFYDRYIRGLWVAADGLIYDMFDAEAHVVTTPPETEGKYYVSSDFGIQNATTFLLWRKVKGSDAWVCLREFYYSGKEERRQKTVKKLVDDLEKMLDGITPVSVVVDPSAAALIAELRERGFKARSANNDVLNGISDVASLLTENRLLFCDCCKMTIQEFGEYIWDEKKQQHGEDAPVKEHDHCMDAVRYFVKTMRLVKPRVTYKSPFG